MLGYKVEIRVLGYIVGIVWLHHDECWVTWLRLLVDMVGSVGLYRWGVGLHGGVLSYMVESIRLHGGECCVTWGILDYMEGTVGLPGDFPIRERLFRTGVWGGGGV